MKATHKNELFYIEIQNTKKRIKGNNFIHNSIKNDKVLGNLSKDMCIYIFVQWKWYDFDERNWRRQKQIERYSIFMVGRYNGVKMSILSKAICISMWYLLKFQWYFPQKQKQKLLKFVWNNRKSPNSPINPEKEKKKNLKESQFETIL